MLTAMGDIESQDSYTASVNLTDILGVEMIIIISLQVRDREVKPFSQLLSGSLDSGFYAALGNAWGHLLSEKLFSSLLPPAQVDYERPFTGGGGAPIKEITH